MDFPVVDASLVVVDFCFCCTLDDFDDACVPEVDLTGASVPNCERVASIRNERAVGVR